MTNANWNKYYKEQKSIMRKEISKIRLDAKLDDYKKRAAQIINNEQGQQLGE